MKLLNKMHLLGSDTKAVNLRPIINAALVYFVIILSPPYCIQTQAAIADPQFV